MKTRILFNWVFIAFALTLIGNNVFGQSAPIITYTAPAPYTVGTAIPPLSPGNTGGAVASLSFGTGVKLTGATLSKPYGMAIDPSGDIYVSNYGNNTVSKYSSTGAYQGTYGSSVLSNPVGIVFDASGNGYVLNFNHTNNGNGNFNDNAYVSQYGGASGTYGSTIIQGLGTSNGITIDASGNLYTAEGSANGGNKTVAQYNTAGYLAFTLSGTTNPVAVAVDNSGNIYVLDNTNKNVTEYNSTGTFQGIIITGLSNPNAICIDGAGDIYIGDSGTKNVTVYNAAGSLLTTISTNITDPRGLVTDSKGNLYVSDYTNGTVYEYSPKGGYYLGGTLPPGLSFDNTTGTFSGIPTTTFVSTTYTVTAYNAGGSGSTTVTLSCPGTSLPTISYNPSINVFTTNSAITPLVPTTTQSPNSFSISPGLPTNTLSFDPSTGTISGTPTVTSAATLYTITCSNSYGSSSTVLSIACVIDDYYIGNGGGGGDWNNSKSWSAGIPGPTDRASIGVVNYKGAAPTVSANTSAYYVTFGAAHSATLTINTGATLTIKNILTVNNDAKPILAGAGAINIVPAAVVNINGSGTLTISSPLTFTLQSDATGAATVDQITTGSITGTVSVQRFITGGSGYRGYRLLSSPVYGTAISSNNIFSINYLINSCFIKGTTGTSGGFDAAGNPNIYLFRENLASSNSSFTSGNFRGINTLGVAPNYNYLIDGDAGTFNIPVGNGYLFFFRGDRNATGQTLATESVTTYVPTNTTLTATGTLNQGQITVKDWYTPSSSNLGWTNTTGNSSVQGFNLVGNPYACSINWDTYSTTSSTAGIYAPNVGQYIYVLDPVSQNYNVYQAGTSGIGTIGDNSNILPSGQGFFVQTASSSAQLVFNEAAKIPLSQANSTNGNLYLGKPAQTAVSQYLHLKLTKDSVNSINTDGILISFNSGAKPAFVQGEDAMYKPGNGWVSLSSMSADSVALAINTLALPNLKPYIVPLNVIGYAEGTYQLNMKEIKTIPEIYEIWLMDASKKDSLDMRHNPTYSFNIDWNDPASYASNRFSLVIRQNPALGVHLLNFTANKASGGAQIVWKTENEQNYTNFTVERSSNGGAVFDDLDGTISSALGTYSLLDKNPPKAADQYRLKIEDLNGAISYSNVVTLIYGNSNNSKAGNINIYPNPASSVINLSINQKSGSAANLSGLLSLGSMPSLAATPTNSTLLYEIKIISATGSIIKAVTLSSATWQGNVSGLAPGTYFIQVYNKNDKSLIGRNTFVKL